MLIQSLANSQTVHSRRKRFVSMLDYWGGESSKESQFAVPEKIVKNVRPGSPYEDRVRDTGYLGRPGPLMATFLKWDRSFEELGPTFSTMLGLSRVYWPLIVNNFSNILLPQDLMENTDVYQSLVKRTLGHEGFVYEGSDQRKR